MYSAIAVKIVIGGGGFARVFISLTSLHFNWIRVMNMSNSSLRVQPWCYTVLFMLFVTSAKGDCTLSIQSDFPAPQPLFLRNGHFMLPTDLQGNITVATAEGITAACPGDKTHLRFGNESVELNYVTVLCVSNKIFEYGDWIGPISHLRCNREPVFTAERSGRKCYKGNDIIRVGYKIKNKFYKTYEVCFNSATSIAEYVSHSLNIAHAHQRGVKRWPFSAGPFFGGVPVASIYKTQRERFTELFGPELTHKYLTKNQFLTRGHLAPRADFLFAGWQRTSFLYINAVPQWRSNNMGNWEALENSVRSRVSGSRGVHIHTGTYNVTTLRDADGHDRPVYLHSDENNNPSMPVPMYLYKVVYDPHNKEGTAFVMINNPYYGLEELKKLVFCEDICRGPLAPRWLRWRPDDPKRGYSFCCRVPGFAEIVKNLPKMDIHHMFTIYEKGI